MSDHISGSSTVEYRISKSVEDQMLIMCQKMDYYLSKINILEENLNRERKLKAGFKVIISNLNSENRMLRAKVLKKQKKKLEQTMQNEQTNRTSPNLCDPNLFIEDKNIMDENQAIKQKSTSTQTFPVDKHGKETDIHSWSLYGFPQSCSITEKFVSSYKDTNKCQCEHKESELLMKINELTQKLEESNLKLKDADERTEMMMIQMETYKSDFMSERSDRENAMGRLAEVEKQFANLKRMSEEHSHQFVGSRASFHDQNFHPPTFIDDILIARGSSIDPLQETSRPLEQPLNSDKVTPAHKPGNETNRSSSCESLNLLTTELGGDDYYR